MCISEPSPAPATTPPPPPVAAAAAMKRRRRSQRDKLPLDETLAAAATTTTDAAAPASPPPPPRRLRARDRRASDGASASGGVRALLPSALGLAVLVVAGMAHRGFRGRATVAGIDLGTTNSVVCVQAPAKGVGRIDCVRDPRTGSPIVPSVVGFLDPAEARRAAPATAGSSSRTAPSPLDPPPSRVVVGQAAKQRIDSHPHHTLYHAKRVLGLSPDDAAVRELQREVEFAVVAAAAPEDGTGDGEGAGPPRAAFRVPDAPRPILPEQVGAYVVHHLRQITERFLGHGNVRSAVVCVPAKFTPAQRAATLRAFRLAGLSVARVLEEPTAAALAYGLHRKAGVDYVLVYDFGGGTLDVSLLQVTDGFVDVLGSDGDTRLGGSDFDAAVARFLLVERRGAAVVDRVAGVVRRLAGTAGDGATDLEEVLSAECHKLEQIPLCTASSFHTLGEQLKIALSAFPEHDGRVEAQCHALRGDAADDAIRSVKSFCEALAPVTLTLTSQEYDRAVQPLYDRSILPVDRLLKDLDLTPSDVDEVVLVGGTTRMPQIRALVRRALPVSELNTHIDPDITVAYGAASVID